MCSLHEVIPDAREDEEQCRTFDYPCLTLRALAAVYSDHPDYDPAWRPEA